MNGYVFLGDNEMNRQKISFKELGLDKMSEEDIIIRLSHATNISGYMYVVPKGETIE